MTDKFIKLSFKNAKLFPKNEKTKDFVNLINLNSKNKLILKREKRTNLKFSSFKEPITVHQISNILHVLVGERPKSSFRESFYSRNDSIFQLANNSYLRINSPKTTIVKKDETIETYISEFTKLGKSASDSWKKDQTIQWFKIKKYMGPYFDEFITLINKSLGYDVLSQPFENLLNSKSKFGTKLDDVISYLFSKEKTPIVNFLTKEAPDRSEITKNILLGETIVSGIDKVFVINGEILVPYEQSFVDKLMKNTANLLDGGFVRIEGVFYDDELTDIDGFIKMSDISDEKH